jgi:lysozyme family protein
VKFTGTMSFFGGPEDIGVGPNEGLALIEPNQIDGFDELDLFLPQQPPGTTGLARRLNPAAFYCAMRWDYNITPREWLLGQSIIVTNPATGRSVSVQPVDWGPSDLTGRIIDLSPGAGQALELDTDGVCVVEVPTPPLRLVAGATPFDVWMPYILIDEGPEVNASKDEPGGISKYGVSLSAYSDYCKSLGLPAPTVDDVSNLTSDTASIFYVWFFEPFTLDKFTPAIAYRIADLVVTLGRDGAFEALCETLGIWPIVLTMTPALVQAINAVDQKQLIWGMSGAWLATKRTEGGIVGKQKYGNGWNARRNKAHGRSMAMIAS